MSKKSGCGRSVWNQGLRLGDSGEQQRDGATSGDPWKTHLCEHVLGRAVCPLGWSREGEVGAEFLASFEVSLGRWTHVRRGQEGIYREQNRVTPWGRWTGISMMGNWRENLKSYLVRE